MDQSKVIRLVSILVGILIVVLIFSSSLFVSIGTGERGIKYKPLSGGLDIETVYGQGLKFKMPWNTMIIYEIRKQENEQSMEVLSSNGLDIAIDVSIRYRPIEDKIGYLHDQIGKNYNEKIIIPELRSSTREVIGNYKPEELYSSSREKIQDKIYQKTKDVLDDNYIDVDALLIRSIQLPNQIKRAIERKLEEQQAIQQKEYSKQKAKKEAERKEIEARGKAEANRIIDESLTNKVLREKAITATENLATSENSKTVIIGSGEDGLPVMLNSAK